MKTRNIRRLFTLLTAALLALAVCGTARAEDYSAANMRLLHYEGEVEILDASGNPRFIMENARFASGEAMRTGPQSSASVSLDATKILTLDADSRVGFFQQGGAMVLKLEKGALFLDVQEQLGENETLDIQTSNMTVGIRGTIVYVRSESIEDEIGPGLMTTLGVLEGTAQMSWTDDRGRQQAAPVPAGNKAVVIDRIKEASAAPAQAAEVSPLEAEDVEGFVRELVTGDEQLFQRVTENNAYLIGADENWTWDGAVTLVAQSASKLYDGKALTRPGDRKSVV